MKIKEIAWALWHIICDREHCSIVTKASTNLGLEGDNVKNIISPHEGGYILIRWS